MKLLIVNKQAESLTLKLSDQQAPRKCKKHIVKDHKTDSGNVSPSNVNILDYFRSSANVKADKGVSRVITQRIQNEFSDIFTGFECFKGTFKLRVKEGSHPYQALARRVAYALQQPLKQELDR